MFYVCLFSCKKIKQNVLIIDYLCKKEFSVCRISLAHNERLSKNKKNNHVLPINLNKLSIVESKLKKIFKQVLLTRFFTFINIFCVFKIDENKHCLKDHPRLLAQE